MCVFLQKSVLAYACSISLFVSNVSMVQTSIFKDTVMNMAFESTPNIAFFEHTHSRLTQHQYNKIMVSNE